MTSVRFNYLVVGLFTLAVVGGLVAVIFLMTGRTGEMDTFYTELDNVAGLGYGTQVLFEGYPVGQVDRIEPLESRPTALIQAPLTGGVGEGGTAGPGVTPPAGGEEGAAARGGKRFRVELTVHQGWFIPRDSVAMVEAQKLLGAVTLSIIAGRDARRLEPGGTLTSREAVNMMSAVTSVAEQMGRMGEEGIKPLLDNLSTMADQMGTMVDHHAPSLLANLNQVVANLAALSQDLEGAGKSTHQFLQESQGLVTDTRALVNEARGLVGDVRTVVGENRQNLKEASQELRFVTTTLSRHISPISQHLEQASRDMSEFSRRIKENPSLLLMGKGPEERGRR